ncbi:MAG: BspA family leucine-rich repeat surface protein [Algibacter sp.]
MKQKNYLKKLSILLLTLVCISAVAQNDNALNFDMAPYIIGEYFSLPKGNNDEFTLELWVKINITDPDLADDRYCIASSTGGTGNVYAYEFNISNEHLHYAEWSENYSSHSSSVNINDDVWHHVAFVRKAYPGDDSADNNIFLYLDGVETYSGKGSDTSDFETDYFTIGAYKARGQGDGGVYQHDFIGTMDELRIWNYAKTQNEIREQMISKSLDGNVDNFGNLLAYYPFDEGTGGGTNTGITEVVDASGNGHDGELVNFTLTGETSNFVSAIEDYTTVEQGTFITTWTVTDDATGLDITIPINNNSFYGNFTYNYTVDWGDGNSTNENGDADHDYLNAGTYTVTISGDFPAISFDDGNILTANAKKIRTVEQWGFIEWESMADAFEGCANIDVVASDTPNLNAVEFMWGAFRSSGVTGQNTDFNSWDVSNVEAFSLMFENSNFDANIDSWDFSSAALNSNGDSQSDNIFGRQDNNNLSDLAPISCLNTSLSLIGWANNANTPSGISIAVPDYFNVENAYDNLSWTITKKDEGICSADIESEYFITTWTVDNTDLEITIPINTGYNYAYFVDWGDKIEYNQTGSATHTHTYETAGDKTVSIIGDFPAISFNNGGDKDKITEVTQWGSIQWQSMANAFYGCTNLTVTAEDTPILDDVTNMHHMFAGATSLEAEENSDWDWDVSNVEAMYSLFNGASAFNGDLGNWNVSKVTNMGHMFHEANAFNQDIRGWVVTQVEYVDNMFKGADDFNQNLDLWKLENVLNIAGMFTDTSMDCSNYTDILTGWGDNEDTASGSGDEFTLDVGDYDDSAADAVLDLEAKGWIINGTEVTECPALSINNEVFNKSLSVSPNPVTSLLTINSPAGFELKSASVYSIMGKQVLSTTSTNIDTNNLPSGLYILKIENTEGQIAIKKIVKQ